MMRSRSLLLLLLSAGVSVAQAQLVVNNSLTPAQLLQNVLLGGNVQVSNIRFNGAPATTVTAQMGTFDATNAHLGIGTGVLITTGGITNALGPNNENGATETGGDYDMSDPDLVELASPPDEPVEIHDAAVLEFDFIPDGDSLAFNYIFASDEYPDFVCSEYNDAFGFFLSGPGINGGFSNNAINIALVPGTTVPVSINTVNNGEPGLFYDEEVCDDADPNWHQNVQYFVYNGDGYSSPYDSDPHYLQYNGFTTTLTARAHVQCRQTYHIKICIGDAFDDAYDSGVFLKAGSFNASALPPIIASTVTGDGVVAEACEGSYFVVHRPEGVDSTLVIPFLLEGAATPNVDYTAPTSPFILPEGQDSLVVDLQPRGDGLAEGQETVTLRVYTFNSCGDTISSSTTLVIADYEPLRILTPTPVSLECDQDSVLLTAQVAGGYGPISVDWGTLPSVDGQLWIPGHETATYTVHASDLCPSAVSKAIVVDSGCEVVVPNVITPNGDGFNDAFVVLGILGKPNSVQLIDRWGKEVFSANNYRNNYTARDLADGTYFYVVKVKDVSYAGTLTVLNNGR